MARFVPGRSRTRRSELPGVLCLIDIGQERVEVDREIVQLVARNEGMTLDGIHRRLHAPLSLVKKEVRALADWGALRVEPGRIGMRCYVAKMSDTVEDCLVKIRALASRGIQASKDHEPVVDI